MATFEILTQSNQSLEKSIVQTNDKFYACLYGNAYAEFGTAIEAKDFLNSGTADDLHRLNIANCSTLINEFSRNFAKDQLIK